MLRAEHKEVGVRHGDAREIVAEFRRVRAQSEALTADLTPEDMVVQSMPDASPSKWHLAHGTWFFEKLVLEPNAPNYKPFDKDFFRLYNSYYHSLGERHPRAARGLVSRPSLARVMEYRAVVSEQVLALAERNPAVLPMVMLGNHHEQQHQELLLMDILNLFAANPTMPLYKTGKMAEVKAATPLKWHKFAAKLRRIGHGGDGFAYDCEGPRHKFYVAGFSLANRTVTNGEWLEFIADGGYDESRFWLSDGWDWRRKHDITAPLYWRENNGAQFTLGGLIKLNKSAPVCHVSHYEAYAFAKYAGRRLPTEQEWETAAAESASGDGNFLESDVLTAKVATKVDGGELVLRPGNLWEWTASAFLPYPGYVAPGAALGEYNGKFMSSQMVMRGGSFATPRSHYRHGYRNFFYPHMRWQFGGVRLADSKTI